MTLKRNENIGNNNNIIINIIITKFHNNYTKIKCLEFLHYLN
jgi:hypothetical protein